MNANARVENGEYPFFTCAKEPDKINSFAFDADVILIAGNGDFHITEYDGKFNAYQRTYVIEPNRTVALKKYLFYFFKSLGGYFNQASMGTGVKYIKLGTISDIEINLPPLEEQIRIAKRLEEAEKQSLSIQSESDRLLQDISDFRQEVLTRAFRGDLTEQNFDEGTGQELLEAIRLEKQSQQPTKGKKKAGLAQVTAEEEPYELPPNWTWTRLGEVYSVLMGQSPKGEYTNEKEGFSLVGGPADMGDRFPNPQRKTTAPTLLTEPDDIIYTIRATIGKINISDGVYCAGRGVSLFRKQYTDTDLKFLELLMVSLKEHVLSKATGTTFRQVNKKDIEEITIPLPPLSEQERIVAKIEAIFSALDVMEDTIKKQKDEAKSCYEEILRKEMVIEKSDDECEKELEVTSKNVMEQRVG